jgi:hypothetical protein
MEDRKTRFDQVPVTVAMRALGISTGRAQGTSKRNPILRNSVPRRAGRRRGQRRLLDIRAHRDRMIFILNRND